MKLPLEFIEKYKALLGDEAAAFFASFDEAAVSAFRLNPLKKWEDFDGQLTDKIPDSRWGYYGKLSGRQPEFLTGLAYSQEPAAQLVGEWAEPERDCRVLDLCAAPGGKSTHLLSFLANTGLLVANEISSKRSKILVENIERFGARNAVLLNESPERLSAVFPQYFDVIVCDAPCSGEGMFRKDPEAVQYWSPDYVRECASRQREILASAVKMLSAGGNLIYSTCTWSPEEDEDIISELTARYPELKLIKQQKIWPHKHKGEGQFIAKLLNTGASSRDERRASGKTNLSPQQKQLWSNFSAEHLTVELTGLLQVFGEALYLLPVGLPDLSGLRIARNGLHLGNFKKDRFEPSYALGLALSADETKYQLRLSADDFKRYIAGETLALPADSPTGWVQLIVAGNGFGFAKIANQTLKNYYPKGLRIK